MLAFPYFSPVSIKPSIARTFIIRGKRPAVAGRRRQRIDLRKANAVLNVPKSEKSEGIAVLGAQNMMVQAKFVRIL